MFYKFLPLAITRAENDEACIGAITPHREWIRPEPVLAADLDAPASPYRYSTWLEANLGPSTAPDARPEDRDLDRAAGFPRESDRAEGDRWLALLEASRDATARDAFAGERSLGLIEAGVTDIYAKPSTRGRIFLRLRFSDASGESFDWVTPEVAINGALRPMFQNGVFPTQAANSFVSALRESRVFLTLGLTKPNNRFPGQFRGCHPLVVGIHAIPDYHAALASVSQ
jgi:hypothetical protein